MKIIYWNDTKAIDDSGKEYIDFTSGGIFAAILGPSSAEIWHSTHRVTHFCSYASHYDDIWRDKFIGMLKEYTGFDSVALFSTGSEANEAFWRACRVYNGKPGVWGGLIDPDLCGTDKPMCDAMHGWTLGSLIMAGKISWGELGVFPELGANRFGSEYNKTSCMIMEPFHSPSGQFHADGTVKRISSLCSTFPDIPLCIDEIQGFLRTGKIWAHEHYKENERQILRPDFITIGKGIGAGWPLSALLGPKEIMESDAVKEFGYLHSTHSGHPVMCSVGCMVLEQIQKQDLIGQARMKGEVLHTQLGTFPVRTHGKGLMAGLEFRDKEEASKVVKKCQERGLLTVDTGRKWVKLGPALNISDKALFNGIGILREVVEEVVNERQVQLENVPAPCGDSGEGSADSGADIPETGLPRS